MSVIVRGWHCVYTNATKVAKIGHVNQFLALSVYCRCETMMVAITVANHTYFLYIFLDLIFSAFLAPPQQCDNIWNARGHLCTSCHSVSSPNITLIPTTGFKSHSCMTKLLPLSWRTWRRKKTVIKCLGICDMPESTYGGEKRNHNIIRIRIYVRS